MPKKTKRRDPFNPHEPYDDRTDARADRVADVPRHYEQHHPQTSEEPESDDGFLDRPLPGMQTPVVDPRPTAAWSPIAPILATNDGSIHSRAPVPMHSPPPFNSAVATAASWDDAIVEASERVVESTEEQQDGTLPDAPSDGQRPQDETLPDAPEDGQRPQEHDTSVRPNSNTPYDQVNDVFASGQADDALESLHESSQRRSSTNLPFYGSYVDTFIQPGAIPDNANTPAPAPRMSRLERQHQVANGQRADRANVEDDDDNGHGNYFPEIYSEQQQQQQQRQSASGSRFREGNVSNNVANLTTPAQQKKSRPKSARERQRDHRERKRAGNVTPRPSQKSAARDRGEMQPPSNGRSARYRSPRYEEEDDDAIDEEEAVARALRQSYREAQRRPRPAPAFPHVPIAEAARTRDVPIRDSAPPADNRREASPSEASEGSSKEASKKAAKGPAKNSYKGYRGTPTPVTRRETWPPGSAHAARAPIPSERSGRDDITSGSPRWEAHPSDWGMWFQHLSLSDVRRSGTRMHSYNDYLEIGDAALPPRAEKEKNIRIPKYYEQRSRYELAADGWRSKTTKFEKGMTIRRPDGTGFDASKQDAETGGAEVEEEPDAEEEEGDGEAAAEESSSEDDEPSGEQGDGARKGPVTRAGRKRARKD